MLLDEVRDALAVQAELVPAASVAPLEVLAHAQRSVRRRRVARAATAAATVAIVIAGIAVAVGRNGSSSNTIVVVSQPTTTTSEPRPTSSVTAEQLRAHDGVGVPAGWDPVDVGAARLFVPGYWQTEDVGVCLGDGAITTGLVSNGRLAQSNCLPADQFMVPSPAVSVLAWSGRATRPLVRTVHGYRLYGHRRPDAAGWTVYQVPQLHVEIALRGASQNQVLDTLAPSARVVALAFALHPAPAGHTVAAGGLRVTVPRAWVVNRPDSMPCSWFDSQGGAPAYLLLIPSDLSSPSCFALLPPSVAQNVPADGLMLFTDSEPSGSYLPGPLVAVLHHATTTVRAYALENNSRMLDLLVTRDGSPTIHELYLGLGRDGRVAGGVLASIVATS